MIPGPDPTSAPAVARPTEKPQPDRQASPCSCELCGVDLPDDYANDTFPLCGECIEELLQAQTHEGTP